MKDDKTEEELKTLQDAFKRTLGQKKFGKFFKPTEF